MLLLVSMAIFFARHFPLKRSLCVIGVNSSLFQTDPHAQQHNNSSGGGVTPHTLLQAGAFWAFLRAFGTMEAGIMYEQLLRRAKIRKRNVSSELFSTPDLPLAITEALGSI